MTFAARNNCQYLQVMTRIVCLYSFELRFARQSRQLLFQSVRQSCQVLGRVVSRQPA